MATYMTVVYQVDGLTVDEIKEIVESPNARAMMWGSLDDHIKREREACAIACEEYAHKEITLRNEVFGKNVC